MEILWNSAEEMTIKDVQQKLDKEAKAINFNTVMTVMNRLVDKGILQKKRLPVRTSTSQLLLEKPSWKLSPKSSRLI